MYSFRIYEPKQNNIAAGLSDIHWINPLLPRCTKR